MKSLVPPKKVREEFRLTYELQGAQKAVDLLSKYYKIRRMKIVIDGRKAGRRNHACYYYDDHSAYFRKERIEKRLVLHEFYHHLIYAKKLKVRGEEKEADKFADATIKMK